MKQNSIIKRVVKSIVATCVVGSSFITSQVLAVPLKLNIAKSEIIDAHTGQSILLVENPSKTVEMTFLKKGVSLRYVDANGVSREVKIHVDAMESAMHIEGSQEDAAFIYNNINRSGLALLSSFLQQQNSEQEISTLFLDSSRKVGLIHSDFSLNEVSISNQSGYMTLLKILSASYLQIREQQALAKPLAEQSQKSAPVSCSSIW